MKNVMTFVAVLLLFVVSAIVVEQRNTPSGEVQFSERPQPATTVHATDVEEKRVVVTASGNNDARPLWKRRGVYNPRARSGEPDVAEATPASADWVTVPGTAVPVFPRPNG